MHGEDRIWNKTYKAKNPYNPENNVGSTLTIEKINCPSLYLCERAIKNSSSPEKIKNVPLYQSLTDYEKNIINEKLISTNKK